MTIIVLFVLVLLKSKKWVYYFLITNLVLPFIIFTRNFFTTPNKEVKNVSLIISIIQLLGIINVSILFGRDILSNESQTFDIVLGLIGLLFIGAFLIVPIVSWWRLKVSRNGH